MIGNKKKVFFLSASDRINYGDNLFPVIFKFYVDKRNEVIFQNYSLRNSNYENYGGLKTKSYKLFLKDLAGNDFDNTIVLIGGGEVLYSTWQILYSYFSKTFNFFKRQKVLYKILTKLHLENVLFGQKVRYPLNPTKQELNIKSAKIVYNAVSGVSLKKVSLKYRQEFLKSADIISVRDKRTFNHLKEEQNNILLMPDSAIVLSLIFGENFLNARIRNNIIQKEKYIFVQLGIYAVEDNSKISKEKNLNYLGRQIKSLSKKMNCHVILCPIGKALKHEDEIPLKYLNTIIPNSTFIDPDNLFEVTFLLSKATLYIGSSLHGAIVSQSYGIPFFPINKSIKKLVSYLDTWTGRKVYSFEEISEIPEDYKNWDYDRMRFLTSKQQSQVEGFIDDILKGGAIR